MLLLALCSTQFEGGFSLFSWLLGTCIWSNSFTCSFVQTMITHNDRSNEIIDTSTSNRTDDHDERVNRQHTSKSYCILLWSMFSYYECTSLSIHFFFLLFSISFYYLEYFRNNFDFSCKKFKVNINRVVNLFYLKYTEINKPVFCWALSQCICFSYLRAEFTDNFVCLF